MILSENAVVTTSKTFPEGRVYEACLEGAVNPSIISTFVLLSSEDMASCFFIFIFFLKTGVKKKKRTFGEDQKVVQAKKAKNNKAVRHQKIT